MEQKKIGYAVLGLGIGMAHAATTRILKDLGGNDRVAVVMLP